MVASNCSVFLFIQVHRQRVCAEDHQQGQVYRKGLILGSPFSNTLTHFYRLNKTQRLTINIKLTSLDDLCFQEHLIENEVSVLRQVKHPNIIMLMEEVDTSSELYLVMELVKVALMLKKVEGVQNVFVSGTLQ